tara:strand:- start:244 stop:1395 length:1152 start_codon:yes stop_codon:yes gene_type:complete
MGWSKKYKKSIDCNNPKGFSQKAHCAGRKKRNEMKLKLSDLKEIIKKLSEARGPSRGFNKLASSYQKEALKHQSMVKDQKRLASAFVAEKDPKKKEKAKKAIIDHHHKVKAQEKKMKDAERDMLKGLDNEKIDLDEKKVSISDILKAVKKGKFPLKIHAKMLGKVVKTGTIMSPKEAPAQFMMLQGAYPRADISIVDYRKKEIFSSPPLKENNLNELLQEFNIYKKSINEGPSREEFRIAAMAIKKQAKFRNVSPEQAIQDQLNALKLLQRYIKKGDVKKYTGMNLSENFEIGKVYPNPYHTAFKSPEQIINEADDHEVGMGLSALKSSVRSAKVIYDNIKKRDIDELEGWVQEKLTLASDYLKNVADYMEDLEEYDKDGSNN